MSKVKYIKTEHKQIIMFSEYHQHIEFKKFNPISAGFIDFYIDKGELACKCYGNSVSLGLKSDEIIDTELVKNQILGYGYF